jgi:GNAT superfamily N-acetyltransferase
VALPPNGATLLRPPPPGGAGELIERIAAFFAGRSAGDYEIWSLWPIPELTALGIESWQVPCMVRDARGEPPPPPAELQIVEAADGGTVLEAAALIGEVFGSPGDPASVLSPACLDERFRVWVGRVDGRAVATATASISDGFVGVFAVATTRDARGRGYGEALTWAATRCRPELPATLQASSMGRPVYERMGYRTVAGFTVWERER